ncbi:hypothetical protein GOZ97_17650 [Agrobacterium vitis]|uniref:hypothetical protein n=1 Tax=Rhizobium/Agrobacterium group TaxID=227290 RepID=UPI0008DBF8B1|nr:MULTISPECIES: hypothetical protein [Rhizobium/Agrobacterium group]MUO91407.1 hypothetical protein [Agrobacterium vitis]MUZ54488.1 hypothetical protein [Agrobacterium vitis]MUZ93253.1 hypothetical protein [Agrobacterium vitis]MVA41278.1 hypothetical protein [Agrobacterium vitis]OHZ36191.1 hypothetical protein BBL07_16995 [Agrobacterium vitis]
MRSIFAKTALAGLALIGAVVATVGPAAAQPDVRLGVYIGGDAPQLVQSWDGDGYRRPPPPPPPWGGPPPPPPPWGGPPPPPPRRWDGPDPRYGGVCSPGDAIRQARRDGLRRPNIERVTPRRVIVGGTRYGEYDRVVLANRPGCPFAN